MSSFSINGRFLLQSVTGVQRVAREVLAVFDAMAARGDMLPPRLLLPRKGELVNPPSLKAIRLERIGRLSGHAWEQLELPLEAGPEPLLCLGNTAPLTRLWSHGKPVVTMVHDLSYRYFPSAYSWKFRAVYNWLIPQVLRYSDRVVTVSRSEYDAIVRHYPTLADNPRLSFSQNGGLPDAIAREVLSETPRPMAERGYGLYVGSLTRRKNAEGVLRAAVEFLRLYPDMRFVVVGASAPSFESVSVDVPTSVCARLEFRGQVNDATAIYDIYRGARFLLFPSFYEASPLPPIEGMSFGCPAVVSRIPSLVERCGEAAVYCQSEDHASVMDAVRRVMDNPDEWQARSDAARTQAAGYSWTAQAEAIVALCEALR